MSPTDPDVQATRLLCAPVAADGVRPFKAREFWSLVGQAGSPATLAGGEGVDPVVAGRVERLVGRATALAFEIERLDQSGIRVLTAFDAAYPVRLKTALADGTPPVLFVAGNVDLFELSSDTPPPVVCDPTDETGLATLTTAVDAGTPVIAIPSGPLTRLVRRPTVRTAILAGHTVIVSPYDPTSVPPNAKTGATALANAMSGENRNR